MKFTDGIWLMQPGVKALFPAMAYDVEIGLDQVTIYAPTWPVKHRGATVDGPLLAVKLFSPMPDVIGVRIYHHVGGLDRGPHFELNTAMAAASGCQPLVINTDAEIGLQSGALKAVVRKGGEFSLQFSSGPTLITASDPRSMAYLEVEGEGSFVREQLRLGVGECVYGLGERFTAFVKNGQSIDIWNRDGGTGSEQAYKNIPFYITNRGYGVFVNHPEQVSFEIASERVAKVQFSVPGEYLEYFVINGPAPKDVLRRYTALTGRPALPPAWSFGLWLTTSFTTNYDEATVTHFIDKMAEYGIPLHVFHFDCFWMKEYHWCNFKWDRRVFPDPKAMLKRLKERGLKICVWINPYIAQRSELFEEGVRGGYFLKKPNGDVWQWDKWQAGMAVVDFTNPEARTWYAGKLRELLEMGVDCFKTDFGERIPTDVVYFDGSDPMKMHNYYAYLYNKTVFELLREVKGEREAVVFARSASVGSQKFPVHWGGDCSSTYESMAESLRGGLSLCLSGFGFWSHDISGFESTASPALYKRWAAFGLLSSHSRLHGNASYRVPWLFDAEAVAVLRKFTMLKCRLMPYVFKSAVQAAKEGIPMMRAMMLEFPQDPGCDYLDRQYMFGDALLVAPVFNDEGDVSYYLPEGKWINYFTNAVVQGGRWICERHNFHSLPLLIRPRTIVAVGASDREVDYDYSAEVSLHLGWLDDGEAACTEVYNSQAELELTVKVSRNGSRITAAAEGSGKPWQLVLRAFAASEIAAVENGTVTESELGAVIKPDSAVQRQAVISIVLKEMGES